MNAKERVRRAALYQTPDRIPVGFEAIDTVKKNLMAHYGLEDVYDLYEKYDADIVAIDAKYVGRKLKTYTNEQGQTVFENFWGHEDTQIVTENDSYLSTSYYPFNNVSSIEEIDAYRWPSTDDFDYSVITELVHRFPDKAIVIGHEGSFQYVTYLINMEEFFVLMVDEPEIAQHLLDKMVEFELAHYRKMFEAGEGKIDILRVHDDYGTQQSLLFSVELWRTFFKENTKKLVDLAHSFGALYQQHSCGAIEPLIDDFIQCGVDILEPLQKVNGLEPERLKEKYQDRIAFYGGIDTQTIIPFGTVQDVTNEVKRYTSALNTDKGGYILMASQWFEVDAPFANIEAIYAPELREMPKH